MTTTLYLVRHAESPFIFNMEKEREISGDGHEKSKKIAKLFKEIDINCIASSSYRRAVQTVYYLAQEKDLEIHEYDELIERQIKGMDYDLDWDVVEKGIEKSFENIDFALAGGETTREAQERSIPVIHKLLDENRGKNIVLGTHGNIMTIILKYFNGDYGYDFWKSTSKPDVYKLSFVETRLMNVERTWQE